MKILVSYFMKLCNKIIKDNSIKFLMKIQHKVPNKRELRLYIKKSL